MAAAAAKSTAAPRLDLSVNLQAIVRKAECMGVQQGSLRLKQEVFADEASECCLLKNTWLETLRGQRIIPSLHFVFYCFHNL